MKAQFAFIESILSLLVILSAIGFVSKQIGFTNSTLLAQRNELDKSVALYDIVDQLRQNQSANACLSALYLNKSSTCANALTGIYAETFHLSKVELLFNSSQNCFPIFLVGINQTENTCILIGG